MSVCSSGSRAESPLYLVDHVSAGDDTAGLMFSTSGLLSGTPTAAGTYTFTVQVADAASHTNSAPFSVTIAPPANTAALWLGNADDQLLEYTAVNGGITTTNGHTTIATSSPSATGVSYLAVDYAGNLWMSSAAKQAVTELPLSNFPTGTTTTTIMLKEQPYAGATTPQPAGIVFGPAVPEGYYPDSGLWVADSANPAIYHYSMTDLKSSTPTTNAVLWVTSILVSYGTGAPPSARPSLRGSHSTTRAICGSSTKSSHGCFSSRRGPPGGRRHAGHRGACRRDSHVAAAIAGL